MPSLRLMPSYDIWQVLITLAGGLGVGTAITKLIEQRGAVQVKGHDELSALRKELRDEIKDLREKSEKQGARIGELESELYRVKLSYAVFREKVRLMITLLKSDNQKWQDLAADIEDDTHDVDMLLDPVRRAREEATGE